jgi:hypothetical protein
MKREYAMIQIDKETHSLLKQFCRERGYKISGLVENLIRERIKTTRPSNQNVLPSTKISGS